MTKQKKHTDKPVEEVQQTETVNQDKTQEANAEQTDVKIEDKDSKIEELQEKCNDLTDKNLRLMAEFDNFRKRTSKERLELIKTAGERVLSDMLPLIDDFERAIKAMQSTEDVHAVKEGIDLIYGKFFAFLSQNGVKEIPTENENFDTDRHEAITTFPAPTEDLKGKIIDCVSKGYTLNEKVIRFSKVVVGE